MSSTPSSNASVPSPPSDGLRHLTLGAFDNAQMEGLQIRSVEPVGDSPDTPAVQPDNDNAHQQNGIMVASSRRRQVDDTDIEDRNVRPRVDEYEEVDLEDDHDWTIMKGGSNRSTQDFPIGGGRVMIVNGRRIPFQKIGGNPLAIDPLGEHGGWYNCPIYRSLDGKTGVNGVNAMKQILNLKHFDIREGRKMSVVWWNIINDSSNFMWLAPLPGFSVLRREGITELFGGTYTGVEFRSRKNALAEYELTPDGGWPRQCNVNKWDDGVFPLHINHPRGFFHGNDGGEEDAKKILKVVAKLIRKRNRAKVVMNHFFLLNPQLDPSDNSIIALEAEDWQELRNNSEGNEEMWNQIVSGIID